MNKNRRIVLEERPRYIIPTANCFRVETGSAPGPGAGEVLLQTLWLSMDPYLLSKVKRFSAQAEPIKLGGAMVGLSIARVVRSNHPDYSPGDLAMGFLPWQDYAVSDGTRVRKLTARLPRVQCALGALGYAGFTGYLAVLIAGQAKAGETVVIGSANSGAAQIAAQIARRQGARVVGVGLGRHQCPLPAAELGYDAYIDAGERLADELKASCPKGVDLYIELVGGKVLDAVMPLLNLHARVVVCGLKALYTSDELPGGPDRTMLFLNEVMVKRLQVQGLVVFDYMKEHYAEFRKKMIGWINNGDLQLLEDVTEGLENAPRALQRMFESNNCGHVVVRVAD